MDETVLAAMARWPEVPAVYGWLRLDRRGRWLLVDRGRPGFDEAVHGAGSPITNPQILAFIERNYDHDDRGRWFWQNGPQRVFVDVEVAPLVLHVLGEGHEQRLLAHTGQPVARLESAWRTPEGALLVVTDLGPGVVLDLDLAALGLDFTECGDGELVPTAVTVGAVTLPVAPVERPDALGFVRRPRPETPDGGEAAR